MPLKHFNFIILIALSCGQCLAKSTDRQEAMDLSADHSDFELTDNGSSSIKGNVKISQGSLLINADSAVILRVNGEISKVTLTGNPASMQQMNDNGELMKATAKDIVYFISTEQINLVGNVIIDQSRGSMRGESIRYDIKTGRLHGGSDGTRIQMRLEPKTQDKK
ncbi:MAG TPA: lipopolysaccharide transport periplasmic protein LptA [Arenimonas sp.]|nr:lipopolysaccharide transport periplasmic protein LptA [Arenimonas sp.]